MAGHIVSVPEHVLEAWPQPFVYKERPVKMVDPARAKEIELRIKEEHLRRNRDPKVQESEREMKRNMLKRMELRKSRLHLQREAESRITDFDPKQGGNYFFRVHRWFDITKVNLDAESSLGPMKFTDHVYKDNSETYSMLCEAVNIFSLKIASLDVPFPIHVYGTVLARDSIDDMCVYLFRRDRDNCQLISSEDESLILTGPKRGLALISATFVETNLKIKGHEGQEDRELSKGVLKIKGMERRELKKCELESCSLATKLSTVDMLYSVVKRAVEATLAFEVVQGDFYGEIHACTSTIRNALVLHDSQLQVGEAIGCSSSKWADDVMAGHGTRTIQLLQAVVSVFVNELLVVSISTKMPHSQDDHGCKTCLCFVPSVNGCTEREFTVSSTKMRMKIVWSRLY